MYASLWSHLRRPPPKPYHKGQCLLRKISIEPKAHLRTWCSLSDKLIGADPLNAGRKGMQVDGLADSAIPPFSISVDSIKTEDKPNVFSKLIWEMSNDLSCSS
ncbi:metallo-beta-lactamase superfamily protein [Striga asiatica]|uniref:Metallo-beta-lactamase superfamily protein n=1 Tax=Striga asiatica TaxID=4170 RepID=A0A5A7NW33_STRAF|nr:metallo-beta-lactamase superfamily protein [Striga asiatica]